MGFTESDRPIHTFTTPEALNVDKIWNLWLPKYLPEDIFTTLDNVPSIKSRMQLLFALVAPIPRAVQYVVVATQDILRGENTSNMTKVINSSTIDDLYSQSYDKLERLYITMQDCVVEPNHMFAILFEK